MNCFIEDFTENNYKELLKKIKNTTIFFDEYQKMNKYVILRHDVDFSMHRAFALSKIEYNLGLKATYFVQLGSLFYNLFEHEIRELVSNILGLGHQIGLHFDPTQYHISNISDLNQHLVFEKSILENLFQTTIKAFSFHNPSSDILKYDDMAYVDMINVYAKYFKEHVAYCSDSNGYWRYKRLDSFLSECHDRVQILTHPAWWQRKEMKPRDRILKCIKGRYDSTIKKYDQTLKDNGRINVK